MGIPACQHLCTHSSCLLCSTFSPLYTCTYRFPHENADPSSTEGTGISPPKSAWPDMLAKVPACYNSIFGRQKAPTLKIILSNIANASVPRSLALRGRLGSCLCRSCWCLCCSSWSFLCAEIKFLGHFLYGMNVHGKQ